MSSSYTNPLDPATDDAKAFKKTKHVVGRPPVTDHNINDEYLRDPPKNMETPIAPEDKHPRGQKEGARERSPLREGVLGHENIGRQKKDEVQSRIFLGDEDTIA